MVGGLEDTGETGARGVERGAYHTVVATECAGECQTDAAPCGEVYAPSGLDAGDAGSLVAVPHLQGKVLVELFEAGTFRLVASEAYGHQRIGHLAGDAGLRYSLAGNLCTCGTRIVRCVVSDGGIVAADRLYGVGAGSQMDVGGGVGLAVHPAPFGIADVDSEVFECRCSKFRGRAAGLDGIRNVGKGHT